MEDDFNDLSGMFPDAEKSAQPRTPLERIKGHAETALWATKSARTARDVPRYIQRVIDGCAVEIALNPASGKPDFEALARRLMAWPIPERMTCDPCMTDPNYPYPRTCTNMIGVEDARKMLEWLFNHQT